MTELTTEEASALAMIGGQPGIASRELGKMMQRQTQRTLGVVNSLLAKGLIERRQVERERSDGVKHRYSALWPVVRRADPAVCPVCRARKRHYEGGPECERIKQLRLIGASIDWQRVPLAYGKVIQSGSDMWEQFLSNAGHDELVAGIRQARFWRELNASILKSEEP